MAKWLAVFAANAHGRKWPVTSLVAEPKFGRDRVDSGHRTTTANRSFVTDGVEEVGSSFGVVLGSFDAAE
jgi:hypothetical protein